MNTRIIKWSNLAIAVIFALFAYVQLNDPDPWRWVALYGAVAILYGLAAWGQYLQIAVYFLFAVSIASLLSLLPSFVAWIRDGADSIVGTMKAEAPHIELTREFLGLSLVIVALFFLWRGGNRA
ncbi:MAG: transmembrane 220 family protein [Bacteroidota bacterium]